MVVVINLRLTTDFNDASYALYTPTLFVLLLALLLNAVGAFPGLQSF